MTSPRSSVGLRRQADSLDRAARTASRRSMICTCLAFGLVAVSSAYNLREAADTAFGVLTFLAPPLTLGAAAWLAHSTGHRGLVVGAIAIAATAFGLSSAHIHDGALIDGAPRYHALALPVLIDGLAVMVTFALLQFRGDAYRLAADADDTRTQADQAETEAEDERVEVGSVGHVSPVRPVRFAASPTTPSPGGGVVSSAVSSNGAAQTNNPSLFEGDA